MIKLIGFKRIIFLAILAALNLSVLIIYFTSIGPMLDDVTTQRDTVNGQIEDLRHKISNIKQDMAFVTDNLAKYSEMKDKGFLLNQDRYTINRIMEETRLKAGISSFAFTAGDVTEIPNADADAVNYRLVNSQIKVTNVVTPLESNIYVLAQELAQGFPGYARIQNFNLTRTGDVTEASLKDIADGKPVSFVNADIEIDWITMMPKPAEGTATGADGSPAGFRRQ